MAAIDKLVFELEVKTNTSRLKSVIRSFNNFKKLAKDLGVTQQKLRGTFGKLGVTVKKQANGMTMLKDKATGAAIGARRASEIIKQATRSLDQTQKKNISTIKESTLYYGSIVPEAARRFGRSQKDVNEALRMSNLSINTFKHNGKMVEQVLEGDTGQAVEFDQAMRRLGKSVRGFRMENLSLMFFGMQLQRTFGGMIRRVTDMMGVTELWTAVLQMVLMPVLMPLLDFMVALLDFFGEHPKIAKFTGYLVLAAAALGSFLFFKSQLKLFTDAAKNLFGKGWVFKATKSGFAALDEALSGAWTLIKSIWDKDSRKRTWKTITTLKDKATAGIKKIDKNLKSLPKSMQVMIYIGAVWIGKYLGNLIWDSLNLDNLSSRFRAWLDKHPILDEILSMMLASSTAISESLAKVGWFGEGAKRDMVRKSWGDIFRGRLDKHPIIRTLGLGSRQFGGSINKTGLYMLHRGEQVTSPTGLGGGDNVNATFNINVYGGSSSRETAEEVMRIIKPEFERVTGSRRI